MKTEQSLYTKDSWWQHNFQGNESLKDAQLVLVFGGSKIIQEESSYNDVREMYPNADIVMSSTSWEIYKDEVYDESLSVSALYFEKTKLEAKAVTIADMSESYNKWAEGIELLDQDELSHILVFADGLSVNGSELIKWAKSITQTVVSMSWGLAGDGADFNETFVSLNGIPKSTNTVVFVWLYGSSIEVGCWSFGGWDNFWPKRMVTKSEANVVYELDWKPVLDLYETYLGELAKDLPGSGLLFPLSISKTDSDRVLTRTILAIDRETKSMTFAGDIPEGYTAQLMKANFDRLIDGSIEAGKQSIRDIENPQFALLISCVGRKLVLKQRVEEELEVLEEMFGPQCVVTGFYSYGEIGGSGWDKFDCQLHNQTMTITLLSEI